MTLSKPRKRKRKVLSELDERVESFFQNCRQRARREGLRFNLTREYISSIMTSHCPIFGVEFDWKYHHLGRGKRVENAPELDKIVSEDGYVKGNVVFLCHAANRIKDCGTMQEHYAIADFMWEAKKKQDEEYVKQRDAASVPAPIYRERKKRAIHGTVHGTGAGEDGDGTHHHCGTVSREDLDRRAEAHSRISMEPGD